MSASCKQPMAFSTYEPVQATHSLTGDPAPGPSPGLQAEA